MDNILIVLRHTKKQINEDLKYIGIINAFRRMGYRVWYTYSDGEDIFVNNGSTSLKIGHMALWLKKKHKKYGSYAGSAGLYKKK